MNSCKFKVTFKFFNRVANDFDNLNHKLKNVIGLFRV